MSPPLDGGMVTRCGRNLTAAIAAGGDIPALVQALQARERKRKALDAQLAKPSVLPERDALRAVLQLRERQWRDGLRGPHIQQARRVLLRLIDLPIQIRRDLNKPPTWVTQTRSWRPISRVDTKCGVPKTTQPAVFRGTAGRVANGSLTGTAQPLDATFLDFSMEADAA